MSGHAGAGRQDAASELDEIDRIHDDFPAEAAAAAAGRGHAVVATDGGDPVERGLLLQPLAAALRSEAAALAATFDASLQRVIEQHAAELFAREHA